MPSKLVHQTSSGSLSLSVLNRASLTRVICFALAAEAVSSDEQVADVGLRRGHGAPASCASGDAV